MDLRQLRGFVAVAGAGTVTEAAHTLGLAPASVSEQVRRLERSLGVTLFERTPRGMRLTEPGAVLLERARGLLDHAEEVRLAVTAERRRVRVGALEMVAAARLPAVIRRLAERRPDLDVDVRALTRHDLLAAVADGRLDAALLLDAGPRVGGLGFDPPDGLDFLDVGEVRLSLVAAPGGDTEPLLVSPPGCTIRLAADRLPDAGRGPRRELTSIATAREWARQGLGSALLPDFAVDADLAAGTLVHLGPPAAGDGPPFTLALRLVWLRGREPALRDVLYAMAS
ncbi:LysR family transcriptional regulator [Nonomuraea wenchangensis]